MKAITKHKRRSSLIFVPFLAGVLSASSFALSFAPLLFIGTFFFIYCLYEKTYKVADVVGLSYGFGYYFVGLFWLFLVEEVHHASSFYVLYGLAIVAIFLMAILFAILAVLITLIPVQKRANLIWPVLIVAPLFSIHEWVKTWFLTGFPWLQASHMFADTFFSGWFALLGDIGVSFLFYLLISLLFYVFIIIQNVNNCKKSLKFLLLGLMTFLLCTFFIGNVNFNRQDEAMKPLKVQVVHEQELVGTNSREDRVQRLKSYMKLTMEVDELDISVWPESSTGGLYGEIYKQVSDDFQSISTDKLEVFFGAHLRKGLSGINTILSNKESLPVYTKQHLVPVGEYMPTWFSMIEIWIPGTRGGNYIVDKSTSKAITFKDIRIAPMICYEVLFGDELRKRAHETSLIINVSNLEDVKINWVKKYFFTLAKVRAMELQKPLLQSTNMGITAIISKRGDILKQMLADDRFVTDTIYPSIGKTPFLKFGYAITLGLNVLFIVVGCVVLCVRNE